MAVIDGRQLPVMYHWAPVSRRASIAAQGLVTGKRRTTSSGGLPYICLSPAPSTAWGLSGGSGVRRGEIDDKAIRRWDLYEVRLADLDEIRLRVEGWMIEVKVLNPIPPERLWRVGSRTADPPKPRKRATTMRRAR